MGKEKHLLLISPLDWGLGHTTRMIPLIRELQRLGYEVVTACNSTQKAILLKEMPGLRFELLEGYEVRYGTNKVFTRLHLLRQLRNILTKIKFERQWLAKFLSCNQVAGVISDNRYGFYSPNVPCVFITHQLSPRSGLGKITDHLVRQFLYRFINRFTECWIADYSKSGSAKSIAGTLSHPRVMPSIPVKYLGCLSRFGACGNNSSYTIDVLILISGPEPQRTIFEKKIMTQLKSCRGNTVVLRGLPGNYRGTALSRTDSTTGQQIPAKGEHLPANIQILNHADTATINQLICNAALIICRSGYTTIMDMLKLQKKMVVVPTPGQTEQEYLAAHLARQHYVLQFRQRNFSLAAAIEAAASFNFQYFNESMELYKDVLKNQEVFPKAGDQR